MATFGYPVSHEFLFLGLPLQIFQRHALQVTPDRRVRPINLLDPDLLPLTSINYSTIPSHDPAVALAAPQPNAPDYGRLVQNYLLASVPDRWDNQPVNFLQAYLRAAPASAHGSLRYLLALEIWGFPTSKPARDPNNSNFIYQRFQRGILQYNATEGTTQGILLADALKTVLLNTTPGDITYQMRTSRFFNQYCPRSQPGWLCRPAAMPGSDLTGAFEP